jgi:hypothetical protein
VLKNYCIKDRDATIVITAQSCLRQIFTKLSLSAISKFINKIIYQYAACLITISWGPIHPKSY